LSQTQTTRAAARAGEPVDAHRAHRRRRRLLASARSLQLGEGVEVIALTSVAANLAAIIGGILVFHEPIGSGPLAITARFLAFCLVIAGAALMPAPMRATPRPPDARRAATNPTTSRRIPPSRTRCCAADLVGVDVVMSVREINASAADMASRSCTPPDRGGSSHAVADPRLACWRSWLMRTTSQARWQRSRPLMSQALGSSCRRPSPCLAEVGKA
jgi:hypothetical protein